MVAVRVLQGGEVAETAVEALERRGAGAGRARRRQLDPARAGARPARRQPPAPRSSSSAERGHRALVAHPERHLSADMFERIAALVAAGALIQATADFFLREQMAAGMLAMAARASSTSSAATPTPSTAAARCESPRRWSGCARSSSSPRTSTGSPRRPRTQSSTATRSSPRSRPQL